MVTAYLGPPGTFSHQAARLLAPAESDLVDLPDVNAVYDSVEAGRVDFGVVALENSVEGFVVPSLDRLLHGTVVGFKRLELPIVFQAFHNPGDLGPYKVVRSHPHALAQCKEFIREESLTAEPTNSTAAACVDLPPSYLALAPSLCGDVYSLEALPRNVQDEEVAVTSFLLIENRRSRDFVPELPEPNYESLISVTPTVIGPGVLSRITGALSSRRINVTSLITRPVKNVPGAYTFVLSASVFPGGANFSQITEELLAAGDFLKVLAVYPAAENQLGSESIDEKVRKGGAPAGSCALNHGEDAFRDALLLSPEESAALRART